MTSRRLAWGVALAVLCALMLIPQQSSRREVRSYQIADHLHVYAPVADEDLIRVSRRTSAETPSTTTSEPAPEPVRPSRSRTTPTAPVPAPEPPPEPEPVRAAEAVGDLAWSVAQASWYGPGFYGHGTACGQTYSETIEGVAHKSLPCGTMVTFKNSDGVEVTVPVIDRGPYVAGREWDLSRATCLALNHCNTGPISYHLA